MTGYKKMKITIIVEEGTTLQFRRWYNRFIQMFRKEGFSSIKFEKKHPKHVTIVAIE